MFQVVVLDHADAYIYGPFDTREEVEEWKHDMRHAFFGREVHVVRGVINPKEQE